MLYFKYLVKFDKLLFFKYKKMEQQIEDLKREVLSFKEKAPNDIEVFKQKFLTLLL